ncbi:hypothetical protein DFJ58DRAFT_837310 [Suillus subalutaceus]|uniref:uncharacterized protein n=1 Tax=Suillus subalutaceus TaxID=48586 RepID=UPI001B875FCE|nr:uncharacterized protein DFJ58DRAFT_837310 [Suillus subalutaceus]KAG1871359.1 hypothetical protein DFJ58DRAFT_837310 [Suillus subalutaceus]
MAQHHTTEEASQRYIKGNVAKGNITYSQKNMDMLFKEADADMNCSVPAALEVCHLPAEGDVHHEPNFDALESHDMREPASGEIIMEAVGFTQGDHSLKSKEKMKLHALAHVLDQKCFLLSRTGANFVVDNDPGLMSYLFPHLDPWNIGGFNHCGRTSKQQLSMEVKEGRKICVYLLKYDTKEGNKQKYFISS